MVFSYDAGEGGKRQFDFVFVVVSFLFGASSHFFVWRPLFYAATCFHDHTGGCASDGGATDAFLDFSNGDGHIANLNASTDHEGDPRAYRTTTTRSWATFPAHHRPLPSLCGFYGDGFK